MEVFRECVGGAEGTSASTQISTTAPTASKLNGVSGIMIIIEQLVFANVTCTVFTDLTTSPFNLEYITLTIGAAWGKASPRKAIHGPIFQVSERSLADCVVDGAKSVPRQRQWNANALLHIGG